MVVYFSMRLIFQLKLFTKHLLTHSPTRQLIKKNYIISEGLYRQTGSIFCSARRTRMGLTHFAFLYSGVISPFYHKIVENNRRAGNNRIFPYIPYLPHPSQSNNHSVPQTFVDLVNYVKIKSLKLISKFNLTKFEELDILWIFLSWSLTYQTQFIYMLRV